MDKIKRREQKSGTVKDNLLNIRKTKVNQIKGVINRITSMCVNNCATENFMYFSH